MRGAAGETQTCGILPKRQMLYPIALRVAHGSFRATTKDENEPGEQSFVFKEIGDYFRRSRQEKGSVMSRSPQDKWIGAPLGGRFSNLHCALTVSREGYFPRHLQ